MYSLRFFKEMQATVNSSKAVAADWPRHHRATDVAFGIPRRYAVTITVHMANSDTLHVFAPKVSFLELKCLLRGTGAIFG